MHNTTTSFITADELFERVSAVVDIAQQKSSRPYKIIHETLVLTCKAGLKDVAYSFGNLSSQVTTLCNMHRVPADEVIAIHRMRHNSNSGIPVSPAELLLDCRALALFISEVFGVSVPGNLVRVLPRKPVVDKKPRPPRLKCVRCTVRKIEGSVWTVQADQDETTEFYSVDYSDTPDYIDYGYLGEIVSAGMQLNLVECEIEDSVLKPKYIIVEPDYLLDISTLASCFEDYGHHPLQYIVRQLKKRPNNQSTLLGNLAGTILDDVVNDETNSLSSSLVRNFKEKAMEYMACEDFHPADFKAEAAQQRKNMIEVVNELFGDDKLNTALLEPSFVCEQLGLQGRVDIMTTDMHLLVEQKSGKNYFIERNTKNRHGSMHVEKHYVQVLLYFGILQSNFGITARNTDIRLLYSKYPLPHGLVRVERLEKLLREALDLRNRIVAQQYAICEKGFSSVIDQLKPETLNTENLDDKFYHRYLLPDMKSTTDVLSRLTDVERAYYCEMMTFVIREQLMQKVGNANGTSGCIADLWNMPLSEKLETGNIMTHLIIINKEKSEADGGYDIIMMKPTRTDADSLPNFRRGDMVYLYGHKADETPLVTRSILFKGTIADIQPNRIVVELSNSQHNEEVLKVSSRVTTYLYAIEHSGSGMGTQSAMNGLHELMKSSKERRDLLLGLRAPRADKGVSLSRSYNESLDEIVLKAMQARDYFLLVGPPGTGKTSKALRFMVQEELTRHSSILLTAYTNRAVDEICSMLEDAGIDYLRIGNEHSCDERHRSHLLGKIAQKKTKLNELKQLLMKIPVVVGTTSTLQSKPYLFKVKHFSLAIVDEASQILEPSLVGLLCQDAIQRFILIGDYKQLPAVVQQNTGSTATDSELLHEICLYDCRNSLFERLNRIEERARRTDFKGVLRRQGRMHPDVAKFANANFYCDEKLTTVPCKHQLEANLCYEEKPEDDVDSLLMTKRMVFIPSEDNNREGLSDKVNETEAYHIAELMGRIRRYYGEKFDADTSVGIIVPYRNQIAMIRKAMENCGVKDMANVSIDTVERYQGSQRDIIIYGFTVQHRYQLEFLTANRFAENGKIIDRKLNVALTRARMQTIVVGNERVMRQDGLFGRLIDGCTRLVLPDRQMPEPFVI